MVDFETWCRRYGFDGTEWSPCFKYLTGDSMPIDHVMRHAEACRKHNIKRQRYQLAYQAQVPPESAQAHNIARMAGIPIDWEEI